MALASQQVIDRIVALLVAAGTSAGANVHSGRAYPVSTYPAFRVAHAGEDLAADDDGDDVTWPAKSLHTLQVDVDGYAQAGDDLDGALAALATQALRALQGTVAAATLQPLPGCTAQAQSLRYQLNPDGQADTGKATVRLEVQFRTASDDPETLI